MMPTGTTTSMLSAAEHDRLEARLTVGRTRTLVSWADSVKNCLHRDLNREHDVKWALGVLANMCSNHKSYMCSTKNKKLAGSLGLLRDIQVVLMKANSDKYSPENLIRITEWACWAAVHICQDNSANQEDARALGLIKDLTVARRRSIGRQGWGGVKDSAEFAIEILSI